jgi:hypothetical protein
MPAKHTRHIVQIMPAPNWGVLLKDGDEEFIITLMGWALVEDNGKRSVVGLVAEDTVGFADEQAGFNGYLEMRDQLADMITQASMAEMGDDEDDDEDFEDDWDDDDDLGPGPLPPSTPKSRRSRLN